MVFQKCVLDRTRKRNREIMHKDKKDSELIEEYYNMYEQKIFRLSNVILGDKWQAEEAVQETFLRIIRHRDTVRRMSEEKRAAYITRIAKTNLFSTTIRTWWWKIGSPCCMSKSSD